MISIQNVSKSFDGIRALNDLTLAIPDGCIFGLLGTNGAGKSTLLRILSGVIKPDAGSVSIDEQEVYDNPKAKALLFYISDDQCFFLNTSGDEMAAFYQNYYTDFDMEKYHDLMNRFHLDGTRKVKTFSKGMKKQLSLILGLSANTKYLFCDETFDGLDPVMRQGVKSLFAAEMDARGLTPIIASHNLRELEDICDGIGLLHEGGVLLSKDVTDLKCNIHKIQCILPEESPVSLEEFPDLVSISRFGRVTSMIIRGDRSHILARLSSYQPIYLEALPLSLEEIFISETEVVGYDIKNIID